MVTKIKDIAGVGTSCGNTVSIRGVRVSCESQGTIPRIGWLVGFGSFEGSKTLCWRQYSK
jgi:hypothetical protein